MDIKIKRVGVVGAGTMGSQIAVHARCFGYQVKIFDPDESQLQKSLQLVKWGGPSNRQPVVPKKQWETEAKKLIVHSSMEDALNDADLVIEAGPENIEVKRKLFRQMDQLTPNHAILATCSSSIPITKILPASEKGAQCINLHFYQPTTITNMVDVMGCPITRPEVMDAGRKWVVSLRCVPLEVKKELFGFCFNRIWRAVKREVLFMWANDYVDYREMDRAWMIVNGSPMGPFGLMDTVGLDVVYEIEMMYYLESKKKVDHPPLRLKEKIKKGELGAKTGRGFYTYPNPEYREPNFCQPNITEIDQCGD